ncbi:DUF4214 domain-containing protein [Aquihabitans sp. G128]|uniref:DUF4214 domain-containing protein n=1 Tax=Aquihabitans sp. G128 TaxID=2849779 RepID=UPI001C21AF75|nr:DUF4214 domain-containing protein [Aquihabitans sp. G128]QXC61788.1 DUF4214 domain-containing protein [Aquihabitans sp. G128]
MAARRRSTVRRIVTVAALAAATLVLAGPAAADPAPVWTPPTGAVPATPSSFYVESTYGGSIVGDRSLTYTDQDTDFVVRYQDDWAYVVIQGRQVWTVSLHLPDAPRITPGTYELPRGHTPAQPNGFDFSGEGRGCSSSTSRVAVDRADYDGPELTHLALRFEHSCAADLAKGERGALVLDRTAAVPPAPNPTTPPADLWSPPVGAVPDTGNHIYAEGVEAGGTPIVVEDSTQRRVSGSGSDGPGRVRARFSGDAADGRRISVWLLASTRATALVPGFYGGLEGPGLGDPVRGGIDVTVGGAACDAEPGSWYSIDEVARVGSRITRIAARFTRVCTLRAGEGPVTIRGQVSWTSEPTITAVRPQHGPRRGGTEVTLQGDQLDEVTGLSLGGIAVPFTRDANGLLHLTTPPLPTGYHLFDVTTADGVLPQVGDDGFDVSGNAPLAATDVTVEPLAGAATVSWTPPTDLGDGPLLGAYVLVYDTSNPNFDPDDGDANQRGWFEAPSAADGVAVVDGLDPGIEYRALVSYWNEFGTGPMTASAPFTVSEPDVTPFDGVPAFVVQQYVDFTGRAPTTTERTFVTAMLRSGRTTPSAWVASMRNRAEWGGVRASVIRLYDAYFDRLPDTNGLAYWANKRKAGATTGAVAAGFAGAPEFKARYGTLTNAAFVDLVYRNVLGRKPDTAGRAYWLGKLDRGASRSAIMVGFSESPEHQKLLQPTVDATLLYTGMLRRVPTTTEVTTAGRTAGAALPTAAATNAAGPADPTAIARTLLHSPAYANRF